jgi:hypothetical protein
LGENASFRGLREVLRRERECSSCPKSRVSQYRPT